MLRAVFDTVVFVRALINPNGLWGGLVFGHADRYRLVVSSPVLREIMEVLRRPELAAKSKSLAALEARRIIDLLARAEVVDIRPIPPVSRDPQDDKFLATAEAAGADYLVSEDQDLLVLGDYRSIRIVDAATFLGLLERGPEADS